MKKVLVPVAVLILVGTASWTQNETGSAYWLHDCWLAFERVQNNTVNQFNAVADANHAGQFIGFGQAMEELALTPVGGGKTMVPNIPNVVTLGQICAIIGKYLDAHPEQWSYPALPVCLMALNNAWP
jgi:hypothetical protein